MAKKITKLVIGIFIPITIFVLLYHYTYKLDRFAYEESSETFSGVISSQSYNTKEETVKAFLENEIKGSTNDPIFSHCETVSLLTQDEINSLRLDTSKLSDIKSAENVIIHYFSNESEYKSKAVLLETDSEFYYYTPISDEGDFLTNSYFSSVFSGEKYLDCTAKTILNMQIDSTDISTNTSYMQTIMYDNEIAFFDQSLPGLSSSIYFVEAADHLEVYTHHPQKDDNGYYSLTEISNDIAPLRIECTLIKGNKQISVDSLSSLKDLADFVFMMELDASYFVKTQYGFCMPDEKFKEVFNQMLGEFLYDGNEQDWSDYHIYFHADYYVSDGRLSGSKTVLNMTDGSSTYAINVTVNYSDFGATEVVLPTNGD